MINIYNAKNNLVIQANTLIEASYKLKPNQQKFLRVMASMINFGDEDFKMYEFKISELMELYEIKDQSKYSEIPKQTKELMGNILTFKDENSEILVPFLSFYEHKKGEGTIKVQFHPYLKPFYLYLNKDNPFTKYQLKNIVSLRSTYSIRFYELLKQYEGIKSRTFSIDEIRNLFKIKPNEYTRYNDFKRKVIIQAQKELPLKTDISFDFKEIKTGRKVTALKFYINKNVNREEIFVPNQPSNIKNNSDIINNTISPQNTDIELLVDLMADKKLTYLETKKIYLSSNNDFEKVLQVYKYCKNKSCNNFVGLMISLVKPGVFNEPKKVEYIENKFRNFTETYTKYSDEELNNIIDKSQQIKYNQEIE